LVVVVAAEVLVALVAVDTQDIGKAEHDTLRHRLLVLMTVLKTWTWAVDLVLS